MPLFEDLVALLGPGVVATDAATLAAHSGDKWFAHRAPDVVVFAESTEQVSQLLRFASERKIPVTARGAGYGYVGGCVPVQGGIALSLARMNRIKEINFADAIAIAEPGVITGELQAQARAQKLFYPPDPASLKECSLGGNVATNAGGPRCLKYGVTRNYVSGLEVVLANGDVLRTGGRVHKNKTGFDLVGLFVGSEGMLGVVTEITVKLLPLLPAARATLSAAFDKMSTAAATVQAIFAEGFLPSSLEIADHFTLEAARRELGANVVAPGNAHLLVDVDGQAETVRLEMAQLRELVAAKKPNTLDVATAEADCERLWSLRREFSNSLRATGLTKLNEDIVVPRGRLVDLAEFAESLQQKHGFPVAAFGHAGDGNIHVNIMAASYDDPVVQKKVEAALDELFHQVLAWGGVITGEHGIGLAKKRWWPEATSEVARDLHRRLKQALDPHGILNPGKFVD